MQNYFSKAEKCLNCGSEITSFDLKCAYCGHEFQTARISTATILANKINQLESQRNTHHYKNIAKYGDKNKIDAIEKQKIELIKNFIIPNTKQDIFEFMILSITNFDIEYYKTHIDEEDISDAWAIKIEQCYQKANLLLEGKDKSKIIELYNKIKPEIEKAKNFKQKELKKKKRQKIKKITLFSCFGILLAVLILVLGGVFVHPIFGFTLLLIIFMYTMIYFLNKHENNKKD